MKHAGPDALERLAPLLQALRALGLFTERTPGCFYRGSRAWLHFHEDPAGLFADVKLDGRSFQRLPVNSAAEQRRLLATLRSPRSTGRGSGGAGPPARPLEPRRDP